MSSVERSRFDAAQVAAHELRHDLHTAHTVLQELTAAVIAHTDVSEPRQLIQQLRSSLERLDADIDGLLLQRAGGLDTLQREPTNLGQLVLRVVHAHPTGRQPVDVDVAPVVFNLDAVKVERILDNLLTNALVHTPGDCPVRVRAVVEPGGATLEVEDDGPGLSEADRQTLLRGHDDPPEGRGMGLWIVERFARLHGGELRVEPGASGRWARFVVWLPAQAP
ncbi:MAG: HAMP domain-containing sensor histidine kinase [Egibacteraceae bacterium]